MIDIVWSQVPFNCLGKNQRGCGPSLEVGDEGRQADAPQNRMLLGPAPIKGIMRVIRWLGNQNCLQAQGIS